MNFLRRKLKSILVVVMLIFSFCFTTLSVSACIEYQRISSPELNSFASENNQVSKFDSFNFEVQKVDTCNSGSPTTYQRFQNLMSKYGFKKNNNVYTTNSSITTPDFIRELGYAKKTIYDNGTVVYKYVDMSVSVHKSSTMDGRATVTGGGIKLRFNQVYSGPGMQPW